MIVTCYLYLNKILTLIFQLKKKTSISYLFDVHTAHNETKVKYLLLTVLNQILNITNPRNMSLKL